MGKRIIRDPLHFCGWQEEATLKPSPEGRKEGVSRGKWWTDGSLCRRGEEHKALFPELHIPWWLPSDMKSDLLEGLAFPLGPEDERGVGRQAWDVHNTGTSWPRSRGGVDFSKPTPCHWI